MHLRSLLACTLLLVAAAPVPSARAEGSVATRAAVQTASIRGVLVDAATGNPIPGALVVLTDAAGARRGAALADAEGRFVLAVAVPGRYTLRAERVGYATAVSEPIDVAAGATVTHRMAARVQGLSLEGITVRARSRCEVRPDEGSRTQRLWEEVRKALAGAAWAREQGLFAFDIRRWQRDVDPATGGVENEVTQDTTLTEATPFRSAPAAELRDLGWVRQDGEEKVYFAPDAQVLLSDEFLDGHCMRVTRHPTDSTRVGLAFEPTRGRRLPDVEGTLWVDRATAELREMEYRYTRVRGESGNRRGGGRVEFERVPGGAWVVRRWSIRMPQVREVRVTVRGREQTRRRNSFREEGGETMEIRTRAGALLRAAPVGALEGTVFDSTRAAPLADAQVIVSETVYATVADSAGRFRLDGVPVGSHALLISHPRLDSLGYVPAAVPARVAAGTATPVALAVPSLPSIQRAACGDSVGTGGVLFGTVRGAGTEVALPGAGVTVAWRAEDGPRQLSTTTDASGAYRFCALPARVPLALTAEFLAQPLPGATLSLASGAAREHSWEAALAPAGSAPLVLPVRVSGRVERRDGSAVPAGTTVRLRLQQALPGTRAPAQLSTRVDDTGAFAFARVAPGLYQLEVDAGDGAVVSHPVTVDGRGAVTLAVQLAGAAPGPASPP